MHSDAQRCTAMHSGCAEGVWQARRWNRVSAREGTEGAAWKQSVAVTSGAAAASAAASAMRGSVARRGSCAGCAVHVARIGEASTGRRSATGEKAAAAATADRNMIERIFSDLEIDQHLRLLSSQR